MRQYQKKVLNLQHIITINQSNNKQRSIYETKEMFI